MSYYVRHIAIGMLAFLLLTVGALLTARHVGGERMDAAEHNCWTYRWTSYPGGIDWPTSCSNPAPRPDKGATLA